MKRLSPLATQRTISLVFLVALLGSSFTAQIPWLSSNLAWAATLTSDLEGRTISEIQVKGNARVATSTILAKIRSKPGQPYLEQTINQDLKSVQKLRGIQSVDLAAKTPQDQLVLIFHVFEQPLVRSIVLAGNRRFSDDELHKLLLLRTEDFADTYLLARDRQALLAHYRQVGYDRVQITADTSLLASQGKLLYRIVEGPRIRIRKIAFVGNSQVSSGKLRSQIATKPHTLFFSAGSLDRQQLDKDVTKLVQYLREKGFLDARVDKLPLDYSADQKWVSITFVVSEGPLYQVRQVRFQGNDHIPSPDLLKKLKIGPGDIPVHSHITWTNTLRIHEAYGRQGYVDAQAQFTPIYLPDHPRLLDLLYNITEGPQFRIGTIDIFGNELTQDRVIRRQLLLAPNDLYDTSKMKRSWQRLKESQLFSDVQISDVRAPDFHRDLKIDVTERPTASLMMGVGVHSDAGVVGDFRLVQRNFDLFGFPTFRGAGQLFRLQAQPGSELTRFAIDFREPYVADLPISFGQSIYLRSRLREDYDEDRLGALWSLGLRFWDRWEIEGALRLEEVTIGEIDDDTAAEIIAAEGSHKLTTVKGTIVHDNTDSIFLPSTGDLFKISYEQTGALGGDFDFGRFEASYDRFFTTHTDSLDRKRILAFRGRFVTIVGDAPFFERYYAGGVATIRGFDFRGVSPRSPSVITANPIAIGSDWLALAGAEYSFPLVGENLRAAVFLDTAALDDGPYRASAGLSIRLLIPYLAPIPLSADFAWPLNKDDDDDTRVFSFYFATTFW